ncbi:hypothetical protein KRE49_11625 [Elizabethkingia meningoseptica]|nr:hypothetical protein [Elizabethkingia meningoseptica]MDE5516388.1 hypothetical protein [Elizabethkingia meningoseptica]MDN4033754.1 hypothetical protein [Elizabethkingia meningoseptica]
MPIEQKVVETVSKDNVMDYFLTLHEDYMKKANVGEDGGIERRDWS